jgi:hypothetical protein
MLLDGWKAIGDELIRISGGIQRTRFTLWRWSRRQYDPLPVRRVPRSRSRVIAHSEELHAWFERHRLTY